MKNQTRQPEVWLIAYRMSEKWVTRVRAPILVSELHKNKENHAREQYSEGPWLPATALGAGSLSGLV